MQPENEEIQPIHREVEIIMPPVSLAGHVLTQIGPMLVCHSCPYEHSYNLDPMLIYKGQDKNGYPITERL